MPDAENRQENIDAGLAKNKEKPHGRVKWAPRERALCFFGELHQDCRVFLARPAPLRGKYMRLKTKMLLFLVPAIIIILACISIYNQFNARAQAQAFALQQAVGIAAKESGPLLERLQQAQAMTKAMVSTMARLKAEEKTDRVYLRELVAGVAAAEQGFVGAWMLWEPNAFDGKDAEFVDNEDYGNKEGRANAFWMNSSGAPEYDVSDNYDGEKYYTVPKSKGRICVMPPYIDEDTPTKIFMTSIAMPIMIQGKFHGVGGIDIELKTLSSLISKAKPYGTGYAMLASDTGVIVGSPRMEDVGKNISDVLSAETLADMKKAGDAGEQRLFRGASLLDGKETMLFLVSRVQMEAFDAPWNFIVALPLDKVMAPADKQFYISLGVAAAGILVLLALVFMTANSVSGPVQRLVRFAGEVAGGNYKARSEGQANTKELQELGASLRNMLDSLLKVMEQAEGKEADARREAERAQAAVKEVEEAQRQGLARQQAMHDVAGRVEGVAKHLQSTADALVSKMRVALESSQEQSRLVGGASQAVAQMAGSTRQVAANAEDAAGFAERTRERAVQGAGVVNSTIEAFDGIRGSTEKIGSQMRDLSTRTESIGTIIDMISDIADQTNLLALNAAIEAARAGEAGRGFAVVADEVRKLAEKTMQATRQVDEAIRGIQASMNESVQGVNRAVESVEKTVEISREARTSLQDIVSLVQTMSSQIQGIAALCQDQSAASLQISHSVEELEHLSRSGSDAMEDGARAVANLPTQARELGELVHTLTKQ